MMDTNEFTRWYVYQGLYMSALAKLTDYLNRLNYIGIKEHMDEYMSFCTEFFPEHDLAGITIGGPNNGEYCKPEEEVDYEISNQQEGNLQAVLYSKPTTIETKQEIPAETAKDSEVVADMKERENYDMVKALIPTGDRSVNSDTMVKHNTEDVDAKGCIRFAH